MFPSPGRTIPLFSYIYSCLLYISIWLPMSTSSPTHSEHSASTPVKVPSHLPVSVRKQEGHQPQLFSKSPILMKSFQNLSHVNSFPQISLLPNICLFYLSSPLILIWTAHQATNLAATPSPGSPLYCLGSLLKDKLHRHTSLLKTLSQFPQSFQEKQKLKTKKT